MKVITFYGGPGTGKSTTAAGLFHLLKANKVNCELVQEWAKWKTWQKDWVSLGIQPYVAAKQLYKLDILRGQVDYVITDGPLLNSLMYPCKYVDEAFSTWLVNAHRSFENIGIFLDRDVEHHGYETSGRSQKLEEALEIDRRTLAMLDELREPYYRFKIGPDLMGQILDILEWNCYDWLL